MNYGGYLILKGTRFINIFFNLICVGGQQKGEAGGRVEGAAAEWNLINSWKKKMKP